MSDDVQSHNPLAPGFLEAMRRAEALPSRAQTVEASDALRALSGDLLRVGVRLSGEQRGPEAWRTLPRLAADMSGAWASGTMPSVGHAG